ncbi:hypothetical protein SAMN05216376_105212 [Mameliella alba]|uniref:hypothetical protein n=1 Tax=Mameliella alba TaxID=561184 RepID=UPI00088542E3|nr:hypothetical protein [Mameliella alba]OWV48262.1 hypothetical protein CDZ96_10620 [Mameliella alba]PTR40303.1 hypothetical protein LX94_01785 [Mameliella alba]GGF43925.1 hypothetical protein GCM10011319_02140 [Mameliella alba]SDC98774.1 hypothetical protein SAMN05216376_105212 [Mameliella alba]
MTDKLLETLSAGNFERDEMDAEACIDVLSRELSELAEENRRLRALLAGYRCNGTAQCECIRINGSPHKLLIFRGFDGHIHRIVEIPVRTDA